MERITIHLSEKAHFLTSSITFEKGVVSLAHNGVNFLWVPFMSAILSMQSNPESFSHTVIYFQNRILGTSITSRFISCIIFFKLCCHLKRIEFQRKIVAMAAFEACPISILALETPLRLNWSYSNSSEQYPSVFLLFLLHSIFFHRLSNACGVVTVIQERCCRGCVGVSFSSGPLKKQ